MQGCLVKILRLELPDHEVVVQLLPVLVQEHYIGEVIIREEIHELVLKHTVREQGHLLW